MADSVLNRQLIFDVGCHRGDDTAYYLQKGFHVVAIEANPELHKECCLRFSDEIETGRVTLINCCVSNQREELAFYINANNGWSSVVENIGTRGGDFIKVIMETVPLDELLIEFGIPHFMKIDVEGAENSLLSALRRCRVKPTVLAIEVDFYEGDLIDDLETLGYNRFQFIRQPHLLKDYELPGWEFTKCSSGKLNASVIGASIDAISARKEFDIIREQNYRWHDIYAVNNANEAARGWPHSPVSLAIT